MLQTIKTSTMSDDEKEIFYRRNRSEKIYNYIGEFDSAASLTEGYTVQYGYALEDGVLDKPIAATQWVQDLIYIDSVVATVPKSFTIVSLKRESVYFRDLLSRDTERLIPRKVYKKLKTALVELKEDEPKLYEYLIEVNNEIEVDQIVSMLEFVGASKLPKNTDFEELLREVRTSFTDAL